MLILSSLLFISNLYAQETEDVYVHIKQNERAPFDGVLLAPSAISTVISTHDSKIATCENDKSKIEETLNTKFNFLEEKCKFDYDLLQKTDLTLLLAKQEEIENLREIAKKQSKNLTPLWIGIGFASGIATTVGIFYVYEQIGR